MPLVSLQVFDKVATLNSNTSRAARSSTRSVFFFPLSVAAIISRLARIPYIRSTKPSNWIPTVTYNRAPAISPPGIFILSYYLISPVTRINVSAQDPLLIVAIPHAPSPLLSSICRLSSPPSKYRTTSRQHWPKYTFRSPLFRSILPFLSRTVLFFFFRCVCRRDVKR